MNELPQFKQEVVRKLWAMPGATIRRVARGARISKVTAAKYRPEVLPNCPCGQASGHRGWCRARFRVSPKRQALPILRYRHYLPNLKKIESVNCSHKGCIYPAVRDGMCRGHLADASAEASPVGSSCLPAIREAHLLSL